VNCHAAIYNRNRNTLDRAGPPFAEPTLIYRDDATAAISFARQLPVS